jgi:hypothetical protein
MAHLFSPGGAGSREAAVSHDAIRARASYRNTGSRCRYKVLSALA